MPANRPSAPAISLIAGPLVVLLAACPDFVPDDLARISCESAADCPTDWTCEASVGRCLPEEREDTTAPAIVSSSVAPQVAGEGDEVLVTLEVDEELDRAPEVSVGDLSASAELADGSWAARVTVPAGAAADEGNKTVQVSLVDPWANLASESLGTVFFDYTPPVVEPLTFELPSNKEAASADDVLTLELVGEADLEVTTAKLIGLPGETELKDVIAGDPRASAAGTEVDLSVDLAGVSLSGVDELRVDVTVVGVRPDNASPSGVVSSTTLPVDTDAPTNPSLSFVEGDATTTTAVTAVLAADGATLVCVSGDHTTSTACGDGDFVPLPSSGELALTLAGDEGPKTLTAVFRDDAFNETAPVSATIAYLSAGEVQVAPTLALPNGQTALKNGDTLTLSAAGALSGTFDVSGTPDVDETGGGSDLEVALEVVVAVGPLSSVDTASRSTAYAVDNVAPTGPSVVVVEGAEVSSTSIRVQLDVTGASEVYLDGDLVSASNVRAWVPLQAEIGATLVAMDGMRSISADYRDGAHNSASASTMVLLDRNAPEIALTITSPNTRLDNSNVPGVKAGDQVTVSAVADAGASVNSGAVVFLDDTMTPLVDAACTRDITNQLALVDNNDATARVLDAMIDVGTPCAGAEHVFLEVVIRSSAGALSVAADSRSNSLFVDVVPPTGTAVHVLETDAQAGYARSANQTFTLAATDDRGVEPTVRVTGNLVAGSRVDTFVALPVSGDEVVELTSGDGNKAVVIEYRDEVGNLSLPVGETLQLDTGLPLAPLATALQLRASSPSPEDTTLVDGASDRFFLTGNAGAVAVPRTFVYADVGLSTRIGFPLGSPTDDELVVAGDGSFAEAELPVGTSGAVWVVAVDEAGNQSSPSAIAVPVFTNLSVGNQARNDQPFNVTFTSDVALAANPTVTVGGTAATYVSNSGLDYTYSADLDGTEPEGVGAAVVRVAGDAAALASGSTGTNAAVATLDFTAPVIDAQDITLTQSFPLSNDLLAGAAGAITDDAGADAMPSSSVTTTVRQADSTLVAAPTIAGDGSFTQLSLGDNASDSFTLRVVDEAGNESSLVLNNDIVAPTIGSLVVNPTDINSGATTNITFDLTDAENDLNALPSVTVAADNASHSSGGVGIGGQGAQAFAYTFTANAGGDGARTVTVTALDTAGNERTATDSVTVDFTKPTVTSTEPNTRTDWNASSPIAGTAADATSGVELVQVSVQRVSGGQWWGGASFNQGTQTWLDATGTTSWTRAADMSFVEGEDYTVHVRSRDVAQNYSDVLGPLTFTYDVTDPDTTITTPPADSDGTDADIAFTCTDPPCTFECDLDGSGFSACTSSFVVADLGLGSHTFQVRATDAAGNVDDTPASVTWSVIRRFLRIAEAHSGNGAFTCGVTQTGEIFCWGDTSRPYTFATSTHPTGSPLAINTDRDWVDVAASFHHGCATKTDGRLFCFGNNQFRGMGQGGANQNANVYQVGSDTGWTRVAVGEQHSCAMKDNGIADGADELWCWGSSGNQAIGVGPTTLDDTPEEVTTGPAAWKFIEAGVIHTCGIGSDDKLYCWGRGNNYARGNGDTTDRDVPTEVSGGLTWQHVDTKGYTTCGVTTGGALYCWGSNTWYQGGDAGGGSLQVPTQVGSDTDWQAVARGSTHTCALKTGGEIYCWGSSAYGQRGDGIANSDFDVSTATPQLVGTGFDRVFAGQNQTWLGYTDGTTACVGFNDDGQCGVGTVGDKGETLTLVGTSVDSFALAGSQVHVIETTTGAHLSAGRNNDGELGDGTTQSRATFAAGVAGTFDKVAAGVASCARRTDGTVVCWGDDSYGGVGGGAGDNTPGPQALADTWVDIASGSISICGIRLSSADQLLECWGYDHYLGAAVESPSAVNGNVDVDWASVDMGNSHACALKTNGDAWCWGRQQNGKLGNGNTSLNRAGPVAVQGGHTFVQIAAGYNGTCAIDDSNEMYCWGYMQLDENPAATYTTPTKVLDGQTWQHVFAEVENKYCGVTTGGELWCWGSILSAGNAAEPYQVGAATNWVEAEASSYHVICARNTSDELWCLGRNYDGKFGDGSGFYATPTVIPE
jgi:alpha-tubulin suppressor-like RCC1 family protein